MDGISGYHIRHAAKAVADTQMDRRMDRQTDAVRL